MLMQLVCNCKRAQKKLAFRLPSAALTSAKVERILELCKFTLVHLCVFLIFCVIILLYAVEKLQSKGEETVWKGFCILIRELTHPYESVSISLCNLRSMSLNVRPDSSNSPSIGYSVKTLHPSFFVWKGILLILLLFQKIMHYWLKGM